MKKQKTVIDQLLALLVFRADAEAFDRVRRYERAC